MSVERAGSAVPAASIRNISRRCIEPPRVNRVRNLFFIGTAELERHIAGGAKRGHRFALGHEFHRDVAAVAEFAELSKDVWVMDFAGSEIVAARNVGDVDEADEIDIFFELGDEVAGGNLFVKKIVKKFDVG